MGSARIDAAFAEEELRGLVLATRTRLVAVAVVAAWTLVENVFPEGLYFTGLTLAFGVLGVVPLALRRAGVRGAWVRYVFPILDVVLLSVAVLAPNPLEPDGARPQMRLRFHNEQYLFVLVAATAFSYRPGVVLATGVAAAAAWAVGTFVIFLDPGTRPFIPQVRFRTMTPAEIEAVLLDPRWVNLGHLGREVVILLVLSATLAVVMRRSRRLVQRQVEAERARANLARYFSPNVVDELAGIDEPLGRTRAQEVVVLFVDLVGFTRLAAGRSPEAVIHLLRDFHRRMVAAVFDHGGTVEKYLGDGLMVTFGTPRSAPDDAVRALACADAMLAAVAAWNRAGPEAVAIGIGVHAGPVVLGDVGDERHLEFAVVGDTVNVASRLEELTRTLGVALVASDAVVAAARAVAGPQAAAGLSAAGPQVLRGRDLPIAVWTRQA